MSLSNRTARVVAALICAAVALIAAQPAEALVITPQFDSSITGAANAAEVEGAINAAISTIESLYSNQGTVAIVFTEGAGNFLAESQTGYYALSYSQYKSLLQSNATSNAANTTLSTAIAHLASGNLPGSGGDVLVTSADARVALGLTSDTGCFNSSGTYVESCGQAYDGVITLNTSLSLNYTTTPVAGEYSAIAGIEAQLNEILGGGGAGSVLNSYSCGGNGTNIGVLDPYRYSSPGTPSFSSCNGTSAYLSVDGGNTDIIQFDNNPDEELGDFNTNDNVQSAVPVSGIVPTYTTSSPEFTMMESIGYDSQLTLTATASAATQVGQSYSQTNVASYGTAPYTYSLGSGTLPAGTTLNTSGTVSGTPTTAGAFSYTIEVTDSSSPTAQTATQVSSGAIQPPASVTTVASSANPSTFGQSVTFTATVSGNGGTPSGTVTFLDGGTSLGAGTLSGGVATLTTSALAVGSHTITTSYGGDTNFVGSTGSLTGNPQVVNQASVTVSVQAIDASTGQAWTDTEVVGAKAYYEATVSVSSGGLPAPTGTVTYFDNGSSIGTVTLSNGSVPNSSTLTYSAAGTHTFTASYSGDGNYAAQTSSQGSLTVAKGNTTTAPASSQNPSVSGQSVTFTATVGLVAPASGTPSGSVTFFDGGSSIGTGTVSSGVATFATSSLAVGSHTITASYSGDGNFNSSSGSLTGNPQVIRNPTAVTAVSPASGAAAGGTSVTITGTGLSGASAVHFGGVSATMFTVHSDSSVTATSPAGSGTVNVTVTTTGGTSATGAADQFTYIPTLTLTATASSTTQVGQSYSQTNVAGGGTTSYTYSLSAGTLPAGTTLNTSTGTVSGTPTAAGAFNYIIEVTDSGSPQQTATQTTSDTITPATLTLTSTASSTTQVGQAYSQTNADAGGTSPYTYSLSAGTLPAGTTLNTSTGTVSGTPTTAGAFNYTIEVTDSGSPTAQTATATTSGTITPPTPTVTAVSPNGGAPAGGTSVTIAGANLTGASAVAFGGNAATQFTVNSATSITATSPAEAAGTVDVTVTTGNGTSATSAADRFTYASPRMTQQGPKLVGSHASGSAEQGSSASLSADGNTAIVGGPDDNADAGAAWIFSRISALPVVPGSVGAPPSSVTPAAWTQAGSKLVGTGASGAAQQGYAVALSGDGNTAIVGGYKDKSGIGAVWIFARNGKLQLPGPAANAGGAPAALTQNEWSQQGGKLVAGDETGAGMFGVSVALSTDGNTAIVGGYADSSGTGAAWIFTRSNGVWSEQAKLVGSGVVGNAFQGISVALSGDGNTALVGGYEDNTDNGAAWVFVRSGTTWTQQGSKLLGSGNVGAAEQGYAVALSTDGNTALVGGFADNSDTGAAWIFSRSGGVWTQAGSKLVGTGAIGAAWQGYSVALSGDASTAAMAGYEDNTFHGAVWVFTQSSGAWTQFGSKLFGSGAVGTAEQGSALALSANGTTLLEGGAFDNAGAGAAWVFVANGAGAAFTATPNTGQGPLAVSFSASGLTPPMTYTVNFGDGTIGALNQSNCIATSAAGGAGGTQCSASASHTYTNAGTATATLLNASGIPLGSATIAVNASSK
jgi:hypothetical protein